MYKAHCAYTRSREKLDGSVLSDAVPHGILRSDESGFYGFAPPGYKLMILRLHTICLKIHIFDEYHDVVAHRVHAE